MVGKPHTITEGRLTFNFPIGLQATKYDDWSFYRNQFNGALGGTKTIDILCMGEGNTWLIEVKDYRQHQRTKPMDLGEEIAFKVRDTLAGLVSASCNANDSDEKSMAKKALKCKRIRVVLHLEQPEKHSRLFPRAISPENVRMKLKQLLKPIDAHPVVTDKYQLNGPHWRVASS